ncbi:MAG: PorT family protein [Sphingobacteriales bacterium]|nr:PorT family protein [Sphingobacteriales bacterium]
MKKLIVIVTVILFSLNVSAQKVNLGLKFSPHISWVKSDFSNTISNDGAGVNFSYGLMLDYNFTDNYALNFDIDFATLKYTTSHLDSINTIITKWKQQYVNIPVAIKMKTNEIANMKFFGKIGVSPMLNTSARLNNQSNSDQVNFFNAQFFIGAGVQYYLLGNTAFMAGLTYHNGLLRMNRKKSTIFPEIDLTDIALKPNYISLDLGIIF